MIPHDFIQKCGLNGPAFHLNEEQGAHSHFIYLCDLLGVPIAIAAKHLNDLRESWLNPPDWTKRIPEVTPLGMTSSPYPDASSPNPATRKTWLNAS